MSKKIKELELNALRKTFEGVKNYVVVEPIKADAAADYEFRKTLRGKKIAVKMVKNSLMGKVLAENGVKAPALGGTNLLCWGAESCKGLATAVEGAVKDSKKDPKAPDKYKIRKDAIAEGESIAFDVMKTLPTREEAVGEVLGALLGPGSTLVAAIAGPGSSLAGILKTIEEKAPAEAEPVAAPAEPPAA